MKQYYVNKLKTGEVITDFFLIRMVGIKQGSNGKDYLDITLGDKTGEVHSKKWDVSEEEKPFLESLKEGDLIKVRGEVTDWKGQTQLKIGRIRLSNEQDGLELSDYIKAAPEKPEDMYAYIYGVADAMEDQDLRALCTRILSDNKESLMYYPAATRNHHAEYAGLLFHTKRMLMTGLKVCEVYTDLNRDMVASGVIVHDMQKIFEIESDQNGVSPGYSFEGQLLGHIVMGVRYLDQLTTELGFPREKAVMMEHMVLSHHYEPEFGSPKRPLFPEAEVLHYLDILDARLFDMFDALDSTEPGEFSDRVFTLENRRLYKPKGAPSPTEEEGPTEAEAPTATATTAEKADTKEKPAPAKAREQRKPASSSNAGQMEMDMSSPGTFRSRPYPVKPEDRDTALGRALKEAQERKK